MIQGIHKIEVRNEILYLLPEGALFWPREGLLAVADFHLGKAETFAQNGLGLPTQAQWDDLELLIQIGSQYQVKTILFLGDLVHTRSGLTIELQSRFIESLSTLSPDVPVKLHLVSGNHDRSLIKNWPVLWAEISVSPEWEQGPFLFQHEPPSRIGRSKAKPFVWAGHIHPCVRLQGGGDRLRLKTFLVRKDYGVLPAFSSLAGGFEVKANSSTRLYPIGDGRVFEI